VATTGCPWWGAQPVVEGRTVVRPERTAVRPGSAAGFFRFRVAFRLSAVFAFFLP